MASKSVIEEHHRELIEVLEQVKRDVEGENRPKSFPTHLSPWIFKHLRGEVQDAKKIRQAIRHVHDFYGWMARTGSKRGKRSNCAGALYRTHGFLSIKRRDGTRRKKINNTRNIHIEHTVPVKVLKAALMAKLSQFSTVEKLHRFLIERSICVAFSHEEECLLRDVGIHPSKNPAFDQDGRQLHNFPFQRYRPLKKHRKRFGVVNVVDGKEIDLENFTIADHAATLKKASRLVSGSQAVMLYDLEVFGST